MSVINKMLRELDRRHAAHAPDGQAVSPQVQAVATGRRRRDLFWLILGLEVIIALGWLAWTSYQLRPRSVVTELALHSSGQIPHVLPPAGLQPAPPRPAPAPQPALPQPAPVAAPPTGSQVSPPPGPPSIETFKLAQSIERPIPAARPRPAPPARGARNPVPKPSATQPAAATGPRVEKTQRALTPAQKAEAEFGRAVQWLRQGRVAEAEEGFSAALSSDPSHEPARQALISLLIDQRRLDEAQQLLQKGLAINPAQVQFATVLARIFVERGAYDKALVVLQACKGDASHDAEYNSLLGAVLQHMSKPKEAADAYRAALRAAPRSGTAWIGLGLALEALDHRPEAAEAFRRAVATGSLSREVRDYAEQQQRRLQ